MASVVTGPEQRVRNAASALRDGRPEQALSILGASGPEDIPETRYLRGTALLDLGRNSRAVRELTGATAGNAEPELLRRALHNLALAHLRIAARAPDPERGVEARAAVVAARTALGLDACADGTRWNLALAERLVPPAEGRSPPARDDGGHRLDRGPPGTEASAGLHASDSSDGPLSRAEAIRLLDALRSSEGPSIAEEALRHLGSSWLTPKGGGPPW